MKSSIILSVIAIVVSISSVVYNFQTKSQLDKVDMDLAVDNALSKREKQLVEKNRDKFYALYVKQKLDVTENWDPKTLKELFAPTIKMIKNLED